MCGTTTYCLLARSTIVHLWRAARILFSHIRRLCGVRCDIVRCKVRSRIIPRKRALRTLYSNISRRFRRTLRIGRREAQSTPLFKRAFCSHSFDTRCRTVEHNLALSFNTQAGAFTLAGVSRRLSTRDNKVANCNYAKLHTNSAR